MDCVRRIGDESRLNSRAISADAGCLRKKESSCLSHLLSPTSGDHSLPARLTLGMFVTPHLARLSITLSMFCAKDTDKTQDNQVSLMILHRTLWNKVLPMNTWIRMIT